MSYRLILDDKYDLTALVEAMTLRDSLDQIAYQASVRLAVSAASQLPPLSPGMDIRISGHLYGQKQIAPLFHPAVLWEVESTNNGTKRLSLVLYDRTIYLDKSEDEYLFPKGQTAAQRLEKYAKDWNIKLAGELPDTKKSLSKAVYRSQTLFAMIMNDLKETAKVGGSLYHPRMMPAGLQLFEIGSNERIYELDQLIDATQLRTLEGAVTKVKIVTASEKAGSGQEVPSKVLATASRDTEQLGTLQKLIEDENTKTAEAAKKLAESHLSGIQQTFTVMLKDVNTIRAGDAVVLAGMKLIVTAVSRDLGEPGTMTLDLTGIEAVKRRYYLEY